MKLYNEQNQLLLSLGRIPESERFNENDKHRLQMLVYKPPSRWTQHCVYLDHDTALELADALVDLVDTMSKENE